VAVWVLDLRVLPPDFLGDDLLTHEERRRAGDFRDAAARRRFSLARWTTRHLVAGATDLAPDEVHWRAEPGGKPLLEAPAWEVNWSHDGPWLAVALGHRTRVGVDIAAAFAGRPWTRLAQRYGSPKEAQRVRHADDPATAFLEVWTRKEALLKATGEGIRRQLSGLCVLGDEPEPGWRVANGPPPAPDVRVATSWQGTHHSGNTPRWRRLEEQASAWCKGT
jgi:phosphopantetheinyl transferase